MNYLFTLIISIYSFYGLAKKDLVETWSVIKTEKDSTIKEGFSKVILIVEDVRSHKLIKNAKINLNTNTPLGVTNNNGQLDALFNIGEHRICVDTPKKNSLVFYYSYQSQYSYLIKVVLRKKPKKIRLKRIKKRRKEEDRPVKKPVIYLYPTQEQQINVSVQPKGEFTFTYPKYPIDGWTILAKPNGEIVYQNKTYRYLFWEGKSTILNEIDSYSGFIVHSDTVVQFLEHTLTKVGFSTIEQADFITFWAPVLEQNPLNFIHFEFNQGYEKYISNLSITPKPDSFIRIFMTFKPIAKMQELTPQTIPTYSRKGFTVVEWGGSEILEIKPIY